jgi:hypothetical protein
LAFLDNTGEALAGLLRKGNAGSGTAADHIEVLDLAVEQLPDVHRYGTDILVRTDTAGCAKAFLAHIRGLRREGMRSFFSVGTPITQPIRDAIVHATAWICALDSDGDLREGAQVVELTYLVTPGLLAGYPAGTRLICRRERSHPGLIWTCSTPSKDSATRCSPATHPWPAAAPSNTCKTRHRAHARVERPHPHR